MDQGDKLVNALVKFVEEEYMLTNPVEQSDGEEDDLVDDLLVSIQKTMLQQHIRLT